MRFYDLPVDVQLTYQNDSPQFSQGAVTGSQVTLSFGLCWIDDINRPVVYYRLGLNQSHQKWRVELEATGNFLPFSTPEEVTRFAGQMPKVLALIEAIDLAMRAGRELSLKGYIEQWLQEDEHFSIIVTPNFMPERGISKLKTRQGSLPVRIDFSPDNGQNLI